jgi:hypothetical protein
MHSANPLRSRIQARSPRLQFLRMSLPAWNTLADAFRFAWDPCETRQKYGRCRQHWRSHKATRRCRRCVLEPMRRATKLIRAERLLPPSIRCPQSLGNGSNTSRSRTTIWLRSLVSGSSGSMARFSRMTLAALFVSPCLARLAARYPSAIANPESWRSAFLVPSGLRDSKDSARSDGLRIIPITPQARLSILEREVGYG